MSVWWLLDATKKDGLWSSAPENRRNDRYVYVSLPSTVRSGRWQPPSDGSLDSNKSPRRVSLPRAFNWYMNYPVNWTSSCIAPGWTAMCGALESNPPSGPKKKCRSITLLKYSLYAQEISKKLATAYQGEATKKYTKSQCRSTFGCAVNFWSRGVNRFSFYIYYIIIIAFIIDY
jgi:hypothetical protein